MDEYEYFDDEVTDVPRSIMMEVDFNSHFEYEKKYGLLNVDRLNHAVTCDTNIVILEGDATITIPCHTEVLLESFGYFEKRLKSPSRTTYPASIHLLIGVPYTNSVILEQLLQLAYTGKLQISRLNAYDIFHDCVIFKFKHTIALWKIIYRRNYFHSRLLDYLQLFHQHSYKSQCWNDTIEYIAKNFNELRTREELLAPGFKRIRLLLKYLPQYLNYDERVLDLIVRWGLCRRQQRAPSIPDLLKSVYVRKVSGTFAKDLVVRIIKSDYSYNVEQQKKTVVADTGMLRTLRTFVTMRNEDRYHLFEYELLRSGEWGYASADIINKHSASKFVIVGDRVYNLRSMSSEYEGRKSGRYAYTFRSTPISDYKTLLGVSSDCLTLRVPRPEIYVYSFQLSTIDKKIYAYFPLPPDTLESQILWYNCERGNWKSVICSFGYMPTESTLISQGRLLYLLGGKEIVTTGVPPRNGLAMCYDYRAKDWIKLRKMHQTHNFGAASSYDGKIYVAGGRNYNGDVINMVEAFDPVAGKWRIVSSLNRARDLFILTRYNDGLWAIGNRYSMATEVYDPASNCWTIHEQSFVRARGDRMLVDLWDTPYVSNEERVPAFTLDAIVL